MNPISTVLPAVQELGNIDWLTVLQTVLVFAVVIFAIGTVLRLIFGKGSSLTRSVSASLNILLIYLAAILLYVFVPALRTGLNELPFISVTQERFFLWAPGAMAEELLFPSLIRLALLAFLVNCLESFLPEGKKFGTWYLWRMVTVLVSLAAYLGVCWLVNAYAPEVFGSWAAWIIIGFWALILLTGILKALLSVILTVVNPVIGLLYTFFFSNLFGKQFSKSILTTVLMLGIFTGLERIGFTQFAFSEFSLASYGPACVIVVVVLYLFGKFL